MGPDDDAVLIDGPWTHREVSANGARFHVAEAGEGPLILLLHGFPEFWWAWRHQIPALAEAGYRVAAPDLRGYGGTDKPPRGYDAATLAADAAGLIRALGERDAVVVGHGIGGLLAWTMAVLHRPVVRRLAVLGAPHPLRVRRHLLRLPRRQVAASWYVVAAQIPRAEAWLARDGGAPVIQLARSWAGPGWPDAETERRLRAAFLTGNTPHCALEYYRWATRSLVRPDGMRYARRMAEPVTAPVLQVHGELDGSVLPETVRGSERFVQAPYVWRCLDGVGHFPHEEAPEAVNRLLVEWAGLDRPASAPRQRVDRDRDAGGRPRNNRPRDATGRPLPHGVAGVPSLPDDASPLPPDAALAEAQRLLDAGRPFHAHEVLEAVWKAAPAEERELWRGLAQLAVGLTHAQRGNRAGAAALLRRGADRLAGYAARPPHDIAVAELLARARELADDIETGSDAGSGTGTGTGSSTAGWLRLRGEPAR